MQNAQTHGVWQNFAHLVQLFMNGPIVSGLATKETGRELAMLGNIIPSQQRLARGRSKTLRQRRQKATKILDNMLFQQGPHLHALAITNPAKSRAKRALGQKN